MAIAPLLEADGNGDVWGALEVPWPRPALRPVPAAPRAAGPAPCPGEAGRRGAPGRRGEDVAARRLGRARGRRRRRAVLLAALLAALVAGLSLPSSTLGGAPLAPTRGLQGAHLAGAAVYVVRPGDTLWSIAARFDGGGDPRPMAEALARETGSATVVPGERIVIP